MSFANATFDEVFDDLQSRFIVNVPLEELSSISRVCFQIEQAHWFYEDFVREENPTLPSFTLRRFLGTFFEKSELLRSLEGDKKQGAFNEFIEYKIRIPVCGVILVNQAMDKCILVKSWGSRGGWSFPKGKINKDEPKVQCAIREVLEETGFDAGHLIGQEDWHETTIREQIVRMYIAFGVDEDTVFKTQTRKEIEEVKWFKFTDLPAWKAKTKATLGRFYLIAPFVNFLKKTIKDKRMRDEKSSKTTVSTNQSTKEGSQNSKDKGSVSLEEESAMLKQLLGIGLSSHESTETPKSHSGSTDLMALLNVQQTATMPTTPSPTKAPPPTSAMQGPESLLALLQGKPNNVRAQHPSTPGSVTPVMTTKDGRSNSPATKEQMLNKTPPDQPQLSRPDAKDHMTATQTQAHPIEGTKDTRASPLPLKAPAARQVQTVHFEVPKPKSSPAPLFFAPHDNLFPDEVEIAEDSSIAHEERNGVSSIEQAQKTAGITNHQDEVKAAPVAPSPSTNSLLALLQVGHGAGQKPSAVAESPRTRKLDDSPRRSPTRAATKPISASKRPPPPQEPVPKTKQGPDLLALLLGED